MAFERGEQRLDSLSESEGWLEVDFLPRGDRVTGRWEVSESGLAWVVTGCEDHGMCVLVCTTACNVLSTADVVSSAALDHSRRHKLPQIAPGYRNVTQCARSHVVLR